jgi:hypothetical protein
MQEEKAFQVPNGSMMAVTKEQCDNNAGMRDEWICGWDYRWWRLIRGWWWCRGRAVFYEFAEAGV